MWSACDCGSDSNLAAGGGDGQSNASMGGSSAAGAAGAPEPDACLGVVCDKPPASSCDGAQQFKTYDTVGTCAAGKCSYSEHLIACDCQGGKCVTDPCLAVTCASPPDAKCKDATTKTTYPPVPT